MELKTVKQELPIYWASYIANGDATGLEDDQEQQLIDETLKQLNLTNCVDVLEDISFKTGISYLPDLVGGDYCTYVFLEPS